MTKALTINRKIVNFGVPSSIFVGLIFLTKSTLFKENNVLNLAVTIDLLISVPFIYYLLIRKSNIRKATIIPVIFIGLLIGSYFLPKESQTYLKLFKTWILPVVELTILAFIAIKFRSAIKITKALPNSNHDFFNILKSSCCEVLPKKLALPFAAEIAVFYYGFINWKKVAIKENEFSYHKNSGTPALFGAFTLVLLIETIAFHFLLAQWSITAAWILTAISSYTAIQVFAFAKSLSKRPIVIDKQELILKYGILNEVAISFTDINSIEFSNKPLEKENLTKTLSPLGEMEGHNVIIKLKKEYALIGMYGLKKRFRVIGFYVDEPKEFKEKVEQGLQISESAAIMQV